MSIDESKLKSLIRDAFKEGFRAGSSVGQHSDQVYRKEYTWKYHWGKSKTKEALDALARVPECPKLPKKIFYQNWYREPDGSVHPGLLIDQDFYYVKKEALSDNYIGTFPTIKEEED